MTRDAAGNTPDAAGNTPIPAGDDTRETGSAVVEFTMVVALLLVVFLGVIEVALLLHVRDVVTADAAEGARYEANVGAAQGSGADRAKSLMATTLASGTSSHLSCTSTRAAGVIAVTCAGRVALPFLPVAVDLSQTAHALQEQGP